MQKEVIVSIIVICIIIFLNLFINNKLEKQLGKINNKIIEIQNEYLEIKKEIQNKNEKLNKKIVELEELLDDTNNMLLVHIGDEELDEINELIKMSKLYLKYNDYENMDYKLEKCKIIMKELRNKYKINWVNIF